MHSETPTDQIYNPICSVCRDATASKHPWYAPTYWPYIDTSIEDRLKGYSKPPLVRSNRRAPVRVVINTALARDQTADTSG